MTITQATTCRMNKRNCTVYCRSLKHSVRLFKLCALCSHTESSRYPSCYSSSYMYVHHCLRASSDGLVNGPLLNDPEK